MPEPPPPEPQRASKRPQRRARRPPPTPPAAAPPVPLVAAAARVSAPAAPEEVIDAKGDAAGSAEAAPAPVPPDGGAAPDAAPPDGGAAPDAAPPERGLATLLGGPEERGRPTWLVVPPARVGTLLALLADEGARLLAMTVLPPDGPPPAPGTPPPAEVDLRYHFVVQSTPITVSTHTPARAAPTAAILFPAMTWRERELAGEHGLRFVEVAPPPPEPAGEGAGAADG